tara:strand:+ start:1944 stop:2120 length:177 start_codon:yes stop_codon:yes gene_type:complete
MISIRKNPNFGNWFQVFAFGKFIEEFNKQSKAVRFAKNLAKDTQLTHINIEGKSHGLL